MRTVGRLAAAAVLLLSAGCAESAPVPAAGAPASAPPPATSTASSPPATPTQTSDARTPTPAPVPAALRFTSRTVDGEDFDGASLAGKPVLLWFWAPWCPTCRGQAEQVQAVARDHEGEVAVVGVGSLSDDAGAIRDFAAQAPGLTHLDDATGEVFRHFGVTQQSSFVLLDAAGDKVWSVGYGGGDDLAERVAAVAG